MAKEKPVETEKTEKPAKEPKAKKEKKGTALTLETELEMLCPFCGAKHPVYKGKKAYYIKHEAEGDDKKKLVFKIYIRKKMPRVA